MDREDMRNLIWYGNACSKYTKKKLSEITVVECLCFWMFMVESRHSFDPPIIYYKS
jgi:hypothetical protein